jgi:hypothetical protein
MRLGKKRQRQRAEEQKGTPNLLLHREIAFIVGFYWTLLHGLRFSFANIQLNHELHATAINKLSRVCKILSFPRQILATQAAI